MVKKLDESCEKTKENFINLEEESQKEPEKVATGNKKANKYEEIQFNIPVKKIIYKLCKAVLNVIGKEKLKEVRVEIAKILKEENYSLQQISELIDINRRTVRKYLTWSGPFERKRTIRKVTPEIKQKVLELAKFPSYTQGSLSKIQKCVKILSRTTISRIIKDEGLKSYKIHKSHYLKTEDTKRRVKFCQEAIDKNLTGNEIMFTDEKIFRMRFVFNRQNTRQRLYESEYRQGSAEVLNMLKQGLPMSSPQILGAAGITPIGTTALLIIVGSLDRYNYRVILGIYQKCFTILKEKIPNLQFMQDNAMAHRANKMFAEKYIKDILDWPPYSPDLNPIEILWGIMVNRMQSNYETMEELIQGIADIWVSISGGTLLSLSKRFEKATNACLNNNGNYFNLKKSSSYKEPYNPCRARFFDRCHIIYNLTSQNNIRRRHCNLIDNYFKLVNKKNSEIIQQQKERLQNAQNTLCQSDILDTPSFEKDLIKHLKNIQKSLNVKNKFTKLLLIKAIQMTNLDRYNDSIDEYERQQIYFAATLPERFRSMFWVYKPYADNSEQINTESTAYAKNVEFCKQNPNYCIFHNANSMEILLDFIVSTCPDILPINIYNNNLVSKGKVNQQRFIAIQRSVVQERLRGLINSNKKIPRGLKSKSVDDILYQAAAQPHINSANLKYYMYYDPNEAKIVSSLVNVNQIKSKNLDKEMINNYVLSESYLEEIEKIGDYEGDVSDEEEIIINNPDDEQDKLSVAMFNEDGPVEVLKDGNSRHEKKSEKTSNKMNSINNNNNKESSKDNIKAVFSTQKEKSENETTIKKLCQNLRSYIAKSEEPVSTHEKKWYEDNYFPQISCKNDCDKTRSGKKYFEYSQKNLDYKIRKNDYYDYNLTIQLFMNMQIIQVMQMQ